VGGGRPKKDPSYPKEKKTKREENKKPRKREGKISVWNSNMDAKNAARGLERRKEKKRRFGGSARQTATVKGKRTVVH